MGSHFCSIPAQHWLPRQAHFFVYHKQKSHLPHTAVPVWNVKEQDWREAAWGPERSGWGAGRKATTAIATMVQQFGVLLNYWSKPPHKQGQLLLLALWVWESSSGWAGDPELSGPSSKGLSSPGQSHNYWLLWPQSWEPCLWSCTLGHILKLLPSNGWYRNRIKSKREGRWACFLEARVPQVHRIVILIILLIKVCWNYWILHIRFSQRIPYICYSELQLIYLFCKYSSSRAGLDFLWMISGSPHSQCNLWNSLSVSSNENMANTPKTPIRDCIVLPVLQSGSKDSSNGWRKISLHKHCTYWLWSVTSWHHHIPTSHPPLLSVTWS